MELKDKERTYIQITKRRKKWIIKEFRRLAPGKTLRRKCMKHLAQFYGEKVSDGFEWSFLN